jgi:hypothetical protein
MTFLQLLLLSVAITLGLAAELDDSSGGGLQGEYARLNPYVRGCLNAKLPQTNPLQKKWRVCNSEDPAELRGIVCREPPFQEYMELRIASGNWDSAVALSWLTQIVLSELLGVPTTSEAGKWGDTRSFYDLNGRIDLNVNARSSFVQAPSNETLLHPMNRGDCAALTDTRMVTADEYIPCAHFIPEFWGKAFTRVLAFGLAVLPCHHRTTHPALLYFLRPRDCFAGSVGLCQRRIAGTPFWAWSSWTRVVVCDKVYGGRGPEYRELPRVERRGKSTQVGSAIQKTRDMATVL